MLSDRPQLTLLRGALVCIPQHLHTRLALRRHVHVLVDHGVGPRRNPHANHAPVVAVRVRDRVELAAHVVEHLRRRLCTGALVVLVHFPNVPRGSPLVLHEGSQQVLQFGRLEEKLGGASGPPCHTEDYRKHAERAGCECCHSQRHARHAGPAAMRPGRPSEGEGTIGHLSVAPRTFSHRNNCFLVQVLLVERKLNWEQLVT